MKKIVSYKDIFSKYKKSDKKAFHWLFSTILNFVIPIAFWYYFFDKSIILLVLSILFASFALVKLFTIQHDCGHYSFFKTKKYNEYCWKIISLFTLTPYSYWKHHHNKHHSLLWNLDSRWEDWFVWGYYWTLTVEEYKKLSLVNKILYILYHYPLFLVFVLPILNFLIANRIPFWWNKNRKDALSIIYNTIFCFVFYLSVYFLVWNEVFWYFIVPILCCSAIIWWWLFFVQHNHEDAYWERSENYNFNKASLEWSSYYVLPKWLHYMTWNISYHHIHHYSAMIPSYSLAKVYEQYDCFRSKWITISDSFSYVNLCLWDENKNKLVSLKHFRYVTLLLYTFFLFLSFSAWYLDLNIFIPIVVAILIFVSSFPFIFKKESLKPTFLLWFTWANFLYFYFIWNNIMDLGYIYYFYTIAFTLLFLFFYFYNIILKNIYSSVEKLKYIKKIF